MRSLFWTFAVAFLLVLVTALLLQALVIVAVVQPVTEGRAARLAEVMAREAAAEIASLGPDRATGDVERALHRSREERALGFLVYSDGRGGLLAGRPLPPFLSERYARLIETGEDPGAEEPPGSGGRLERGGRLKGRGGPPGPGGGPVRPGGPPGRETGVRILARWPVETADGVEGEVVVLGPRHRFAFWPPHVPRPLLLFVPIAILLSAAAAFIVFRLLVRRLRSLESLATRVTEGDLDARVRDAGHDEIGRLADRLNRMTESLGEARDRLRANDRSRRRLLADISHELATPMTSIKGYAETVGDPAIELTDDERRRYLAGIVEETNRLDALVKDLFDLTRLEADAMPLERERLDVCALLRNSVSRSEPRFRQADLSLEWRGRDDPAPVVADGRRLEQVVDNLLGNALRYVPAGGQVWVECEPGGGDGGRHRFRVTDDGPGIPTEHVEHVFDRFYRVNPARSDEGTGLGLAIAREIVERHGGTIRATNRDGGGARFEVELPPAP